MGDYSGDDTDVDPHSSSSANLEEPKEKEQDAEFGEYHGDAIRYVDAIDPHYESANPFRKLVDTDIPSVNAEASAEEQGRDPEIDQGRCSTHDAEYVVPTKLGSCISEFGTQAHRDEDEHDNCD
ncbi:MAG: hypothetical protein Q9170_008213, partial [Blastenia crenularia]